MHPRVSAFTPHQSVRAPTKIASKHATALLGTQSLCGGDVPGEAQSIDESLVVRRKGAVILIHRPSSSTDVGADFSSSAADREKEVDETHLHRGRSFFHVGGGMQPPDLPSHTHQGAPSNPMGGAPAAPVRTLAKNLSSNVRSCCC